MDIKNLVTKLSKKYDVLLGTGFAVLFHNDKYVIDINANSIVSIKHNFKLKIKYVDKKFVVISKDTNEPIGDSLFCGEKLNSKYFPETETIKTLDFSRLTSESIDKLFEDGNLCKFAHDLKQIVFDIFEAIRDNDEP